MQPAIAFLNRVFEGEGWAREKLAPHAGRTLCLRVGPMAIAMALDASGAFVSSDTTPDLTVTISPLRVPALLAHPERWNQVTRSDGDQAFAATLSELAQTLPWFVERTLSAAFGPIIGTRVADAGRRMLDLPGYAAQRVDASVTSYLRDEINAVVDAAAVRDFGAEVSATMARVDDLAARVERLRAGRSSRPRGGRAH